MEIIANSPINKTDLENAKNIMTNVYQKTAEGVKNGKGPFYAEIYDENGNFVVSSSNSVVEDNCALYHAEVNTLKKAFEKYKQYDLSPQNLTIYINAEPCIMCAGALMWSGVKTIYFGVPSKDVERITGFDEGRPLFVRSPESRFNLANFMKVHLYTSLGALKTGMDILLKKENVTLDRMMGHGGLFKTKGVGQRILAGAIDTPVYVMETAGEGGAWGIALLADYLVKKEDKESLTDYLENKVFHDAVGTGMDPVAEDVEGYEKFMETYAKGLAIEKAAVENL